MDHIAQNLRGLDPVKAAAKGRKAVVAARTVAGSAILGVPAPVEVAALDAATEALEGFNTAAASKKAAYEAAVSRVREAYVVFQGAYGDHCKVSDPKCKGLGSNITTLALDIAGKSVPIGEVAAPGDFIAIMGKLFGQIKLDWDNVNGAQFYIVQMCADPLTEAGWQQIDIVTASKCTVTGLTSGQKYWFRVAAKGTAGQGPWSDPAMMMAP